MARRRNRNTLPVEGRTVDTLMDGRAVVRGAEGCVFVDGALAGEQVLYSITRKKKSYIEAKLVEVLKPSPQRIRACCEYYGVCGGCSLQHAGPSDQILIKQKAVLEAFQRLGRVFPERVFPPLTQRVWGYRRRARLAVKWVEKKAKVLIGFREKNKPYVANMDSCKVLDQRVSKLLPVLSATIEDLSIRKQIPQIEVSVADNAIALVFRVLETPSDSDLTQLKRLAKDYSLVLYLQPGGLDSVTQLFPDSEQVRLYYELPAQNLRMYFEATDFIQVNREMNLKMIDQALHWLSLSASDQVLDLFCGLGNFTLPIAKKVSRVVGVEGAEELVARARENAELNHVTNAEFYAADLFKPDQDAEWLKPAWDCVVLDPPRLGAREIIPFVCAGQPKKILYVSCHPGTLARDADALVHEYGYRFSRFNILDMFPHTSHVESMALFERV